MLLFQAASAAETSSPAALKNADEKAASQLVLTVRDAAGKPASCRYMFISEETRNVQKGMFRGSRVLAVSSGKGGLIVEGGLERNRFTRRFDLEPGERRALSFEFTPLFPLEGVIRVDPLYERSGDNPATRALEQEVEGIDMVLEPEKLGSGFARRPPRGPGGVFQRAGLSPFTGCARDAELLANMWGIVLCEGGESEPGRRFLGRSYEVSTLREEWFRLLSRGYRISPVGGSGSGSVLGLPRMYVPAENRGNVVQALASGTASLSCGYYVNVRCGGCPPGTPAASRFGAVTLNVSVQAPPWIEHGHLTIFEGGHAVVRTPLRSVQDPVRLDRRFTLRSDYDTFYIAAASARGGDESVYHGIQFRPFGVAAPVFVDADGDGRYTPAQSYAETILDRTPLPVLPDRFHRYPPSIQLQMAGSDRTGDSFLLASFFGDYAADQSVRLAAYDAVRREAPQWAGDFFVRRLVETEDGSLFEHAVLLASLASCGETTGLSSFEEKFRRGSLADRIRTYRFLMEYAEAVPPPVFEVAGPFPDPDGKGINIIFGPERSPAREGPFRDFEGRIVQEKMRGATDGRIVFERADQPVVWFMRLKFRVVSGTEVLLLAGNADGLECWIDGSSVLREIGRDAGCMVLSRYLARGLHSMLLKAPVKRRDATVGWKMIDPAGGIRFLEGEGK